MISLNHLMGHESLPVLQHFLKPLEVDLGDVHRQDVLRGAAIWENHNPICIFDRVQHLVSAFWEFVTIAFIYGIL